MTDRIKGFTVTLDRDIREDDFEHVLNAVKMIKGVGHIETSIVTSEDYMNRERIKSEMHSKLFEVLNS